MKAITPRPLPDKSRCPFEGGPRCGTGGGYWRGESLDELQAYLQELVSMLLEDGEPKFESEFVAVRRFIAVLDRARLPSSATHAAI